MAVRPAPTTLPGRERPTFSALSMDHALGWTFFVLLGLVTLTLQFLQRHQYALFVEYGFLDQGSVLTVHHLIEQGLRPEIDFGYNYGPLPIVISGLFFRLFGLLPRTYALVIFVTEVAIVCGYARIIATLRLRGPGLAAAILMLPLLIRRYDNTTYALEAAFFVHGFAEQLRGRLGNAIALAVCAIWCKPALGYVYVAILLSLLLSEPAAQLRQSDRLRALLPPSILLVALVVALCEMFGLSSLLRMSVPLQGLAHYQAIGGLSLFYRGERLFRPPAVNWHYYFGTYVAFWVVGSVFLWIETTLSAIRLFRRRADFVDQMILTLGILLFADYLVLALQAPFILPIGIVLCASRRGWQRAAATVLCTLAIPAFLHAAHLEPDLNEHLTRSPMTGGLWVAPDLEKEWQEAMKIGAHKKIAVLGEMGGAGLVIDGIAKPVGAFFLPGASLPGDLRREYGQLAEAEVVVLFHRLSLKGGTVLDTFPGLKPAVDGTTTVYKGNHLEVLARD